MICSGTSVTYSASPFNGGTAPLYQWNVNGSPTGTNNPVYIYSPSDGDTVTCTLESNELCSTGNPATSNALIAEVEPEQPVSITIEADPQGWICEGVPVTYTANPVNGGTSPSYQWTVNGVNVGINDSSYTYFPVNADLVACELTSNFFCTTGNPAISNVIMMEVYPDPNIIVSVSIAVSPNDTICSGEPVLFTANGTNGGSFPVYQWLVNGLPAGTNSNQFSYTPADGDTVSCILTSDIFCASNNPDTSGPVILGVFPTMYVNLNLCIPITSRNGKPITLRGGIPLGGIYSGTGVMNGLFYPNLVPPGFDSVLINYSYITSNGCIDSASQYIIVKPILPFTCGDVLTDVRDNRTYQTVLIGTQCWFSTNLNTGAFLTSVQDQRDNCLIEKYCYEETGVNCLLWGGLYQWDELMEYGTDEEAQGICPPGWHVPSENEWDQLFSLYGGNAYAGDSLKPGGPSGFHAIMAGARLINKSWDFNEFSGFFWSSTPHGPWKGWAHGINSINHGISYYPSYRLNAFSIRCIRD